MCTKPKRKWGEKGDDDVAGPAAHFFCLLPSDDKTLLVVWWTDRAGRQTTVKKVELEEEKVLHRPRLMSCLVAAQVFKLESEKTREKTLLGGKPFRVGTCRRSAATFAMATAYVDVAS